MKKANESEECNSTIPGGSTLIPVELFEIGKHVKIALDLLYKYNIGREGERQEYINKIERLLTGSISDLGELASYEFESVVYEYKIGGVYDI